MILIPSSFSVRMDVFRIGGIWIMGWLYQLKRKRMDNFNLLLDYQKYQIPKKGIFRIEKNPAEYKLPGGWVRVEVEETIIGETNDTYVTRFQNSNHGEWIGDLVFKRYYTFPIGLHKSRFVKWVGYQLSIFD
ncbi:MAG: hypothetical protein IPO86_10075 [Saprospiraceae bacterium]|nr:hypothetical protein [Saprospiraceae bacterium]